MKTVNQFLRNTITFAPELYRFADKLKRADIALTTTWKRRKQCLVLRGRVRYPHSILGGQIEIIDLYLYGHQDIPYAERYLDRGALRGKPIDALSIGEILALKWLQKAY